MRTKTKTKVERLMTALYTTYHAALRANISRLVGTGYADDAIGHLAEKLCAKPELWDGNDSALFSFLHSALKRLAFNRLRDEHKYIYECDSAAADLQTPTEWKIWSDPSSSPEQIAIASISYEQAHALMEVVDESREDRICSYTEVFELMSVGYAGGEIGEMLHLNINTAHGAIRRVRLNLERQDEKRPKRARGT